MNNYNLNQLYSQIFGIGNWSTSSLQAQKRAISNLMRKAITIAFASLFGLTVSSSVYANLQCDGPIKESKIVAINIDTMEPAFGGASFDKSGQYLKIEGTADGVLDPCDPRNAIIVDLDKAPTNSDGMVEYRVDISIIKPTLRNNGAIIYSANNRGRKADTYIFNYAFPPFDNFRDVSGIGDGYLMNEGYTIVNSAWDGSVQPGGGTMIAHFPVAEEGGEPVEGRTLVERTDTGTDPAFIIELPHPSVVSKQGAATLTVRGLESDARVLLVGKHTFLDEDSVEIIRPAGFDSGAIYEFIYDAQNLTIIKNEDGSESHRNGIMGIGYASIRDLVYFLRYDHSAMNPLADSHIKRAILYGYSQPGRALRDYLYLGFNEDHYGNAVFEGAIPCAAGSSKAYVNVRFAKTGEVTTQHRTRAVNGNQFPFTYGTLTDPISGKSDGILKRCSTSNTCPKIIHVDSSNETRGRGGSLLVTDTNGNDISLPKNVRVYWVSSSAHFPLGWLTFSENLINLNGFLGGEATKNYFSPVDPRPAYRASLHHLNRWISRGVVPPRSKHGKVSKGTLVEMPTLTASFPAPIPGFTNSEEYNQIVFTDFTLTNNPLAPYLQGGAYPVLLPSVNATGNEIPGVRLPRVKHPIGTYTGFDVRDAGSAEGDLSGIMSSWAPLAVTKDERLLTGDPRKSLEERYGIQDCWIARVHETAKKLVKQGYMLSSDAERIVMESTQQNLGLENNYVQCFDELSVDCDHLLGLSEEKCIKLVEKTCLLKSKINCKPEKKHKHKHKHKYQHKHKDW